MLSETAEAFAARLPAEGRLLALDVGEKTIGLALSDPRRTIAPPLETIARTKFVKDMEAMKKIISSQKVAGLVIGYPINMDGSAGPRTQSVRTFTSNLLKYIDLPTMFWDERLSTVAVQRTMLEADLSRERRAQIVDKLAASYLLQGCLDRLLSLPKNDTLQ